MTATWPVTTPAGRPLVPPPGPTAVPARPDGRYVTWAVVAAVAGTAWFVATSTNLRATQLGMAATVGLALLVVVLADRPVVRDVTALTALAVLLVSVPVTRLPQHRVLLLAMIVGCAAIGAAALVRAGPAGPPRGRFVLLVLLGLLAVPTLVVTYATGTVMLALIAAVALPTFRLVGRLDAPGRRAVATVLLAVALVQAVLAVVEPWVLPRHLWAPAQLGSSGQVVPLRNEVLAGLERSQGTLGHPLPLGLLLIVGVVLALLVLRDRHWALRAATIGVLCLGLVFAGARSSLALAVLVLLLGAGRRFTPTRLLAAGVVVVVTIATAVYASWDVSGQVSVVERSGSWQHRLGALESVERLLLWQDVPLVLFGHGYGTTSYVMGQGLLQNDGFAAVDNQYVLLLTQGGLFAVLALLALLAVALLRPTPGTRAAVVAVAATLMVFDLLMWPSATFVMFAVLGLALAAPDPRPTGDTPPTRTDPARRP